MAAPNHKPLRDKEIDAGTLFDSLQLDEGVLSLQTAQLIRDRIRAGELHEGDRLPPERELGERLGVSRTVVREAIKILRAEGLVRIRLGVGTFVTEPSQNILERPMSHLNRSASKKIQDLMDVRNVLEPAIAALAAENAMPEHIARMEHAIEDMDRYMTDRVHYVEADNLFHIALAEASNNSVYQLLVNSIVDLLQQSRQLAVSNPGAAHRANTYHRQILQAVLARDAVAAQAAMEGHVKQIAKDVASVLVQQHDETAQYVR